MTCAVLMNEALRIWQEYPPEFDAFSTRFRRVFDRKGDSAERIRERTWELLHPRHKATRNK
jgi:hypothetical protein